MLNKICNGITSLGARIGYAPKEFGTSEVTDRLEEIWQATNFQKPQLSPELDNLDKRIFAGGGIPQHDRMVLDKKRSLDKALLYSYQRAFIQKVPFIHIPKGAQQEDIQKQPVIRSLINPNKLKPDYDDKIVSVPYEAGFKPGDVFSWIGSKTHWLIYLQEKTELAYFRGDIRKCSYEIAWENEEGDYCRTYAAIRGPVETKINYIQKQKTSVDTPNHSLHILIPRNEETLKYFRRYEKFYLIGEDPNSPEICWRVEATDWISTPGILEITAVEYYINTFEDDLDDRLAGSLKVKLTNPNSPEIDDVIIGESIISPKIKYTYRYYESPPPALGKWSLSDKAPVKIKVNPADSGECTLYWDCNYSGQFTLYFDGKAKQIIVQSLMR